jgi:hypothetical protein
VPTDGYTGQAAHRLTPGGKYLVRVRGATNLTGHTGEGQAVLLEPLPKPLPKKPAARDTTAKGKAKR